MAQVADDALQRGREALAKHSWEDAYQILKAADEETPLGGEGLRMLSEAAWWSAHPHEAIEASERAHGAFLAEGNTEAAAMSAFEVARQNGMKMAGPLAMAWMSKAERLVSDRPDSIVHGWLAFFRGLFTTISTGDYEAALALYDRAIEIASKHTDPDLYGMSVHDKGNLLCTMGRVEEGMALMDEAMTSVVGDELRPTSAGYVYCGMIGACSRMADYQRAAEWTEATMRWCERNSISAFPGVCRVHRAELFRLKGEWPIAEQEARQACEELPKFNFTFGLGFAYYEIGEIRRQVGDLDAADQAYARANEYGRNPQPGLALLRLAQGKLKVAVNSIEQALTHTSDDDRLGRARLLSAKVEICVAAGELEMATAASGELDEILAAFPSVALRARAACVRGALRMASGDPRAAIRDIDEARRLWQRIDLPYDAAEARIILAKAYRELGDLDSARLEARAAQATFEKLGARQAERLANDLLRDLILGDEAMERVTRAFMFTDIEKSTDLVNVIGDQAWEALLAWHDQTLTKLFGEFGGEVSHHTGDGFFVSFDDSRSALTCAIAIQKRLAEHRQTQGFAPSVRIGVHEAEATRRGTDFSGGEVHKAARIAAIALGGEIVVSAEIAEAAQSIATFSDPWPVSLKGIQNEVEVAKALWH